MTHPGPEQLTLQGVYDSNARAEGVWADQPGVTRDRGVSEDHWVLLQGGRLQRLIECRDPESLREVVTIRWRHQGLSLS